MRRRTRIVATLGPATDPPGVLPELLRAGVDVARVNFSHGTAEDHLRRTAALRDAARALDRPVAVLADLPGPKLRTRLDAPRPLHPGEEVRFALGDSPTAGDIAVTEPAVLRDVRPGQRVLLDDGRLQLEALRRESDALVAKVKVGGELLPNKGVNLPDTELSMPALTPRDREALETAAAAGVDWLALSFVRGPEAAPQVRAEAERHGLRAPVLAKIERPEAVAHADAILAAFDGIMVARGDLGVEIELERVPGVQKRLIALARGAGKPVVTATDMLDSMRHNPRPTRAEVSDVANAIYDGTDAVMLSGETAVGAYPVGAVACMHRIALETESHLRQFPGAMLALPEAEERSVDAVTRTACALARDAGADAILTPTLSGRTARLLARHRPWARLVAPAPEEAVVRRMALVWGVWPVWMKQPLKPGDDRLEAAVRAAFEAGAVQPGMCVVLLAGHPVEGGERLPTIRVVRIGEDGRAHEP
ncbi:MAG TPA: pyruvate kinase [Gemmataceae bacterium]